MTTIESECSNVSEDDVTNEVRSHAERRVVKSAVAGEVSNGVHKRLAEEGGDDLEQLG